jgi:Spy/CpxP family protein refolding chaperone
LRRKLGLMAAAVTLSILPGLAAAQMMMTHGGGMGGWMPKLPLFLRAAQLSPDQQKQVNKILEDNHAAFHKLFDQMHAAREQMSNKLLSAGAVSANDLSPQTQQINQAQQQLLAQEVNVALQIRAVLKPDQLQKVAKFHQQLHSLHEQMRALIGANGPGDHDGLGGPEGHDDPPPPTD